MRPTSLRATPVRWQSDAFPGWVEVAITDAAGRCHLVVEKAPVLLKDAPEPGGVLPEEIWLPVTAADVVESEVVVRLANGIETTEGRSTLTVARADLRRPVGRIERRS